MAELDLGTTFIPALHKPAALLPIAKHRDALLYTIEKYPVTIVVGQTGSGKSTQIPQYLEQAGWCSDGKIIGITQVRHSPQPVPDNMLMGIAATAGSSNNGCHESGGRGRM